MREEGGLSPCTQPGRTLLQTQDLEGTCSVCHRLRREPRKLLRGHGRRGHIHLAGVALPDIGCGKLRFLAQATWSFCVAVTRHWGPCKQKPQQNDSALGISNWSGTHCLFKGLEVGWQEGAASAVAQGRNLGLGLFTPGCGYWMEPGFL